MNPDYKTEAIPCLLKEDCILARFYPLIPFKATLCENLLKMHCERKSDCAALPDGALLEAGLPDRETVQLFRAFLALYDVKPAKLREIPAVCQNEEEQLAFRELYHLPGVKSTRAGLYWRAGYKTLADIAAASPEGLIADTGRIIREENLPMKAPLMKEAKTHIAVARAFTDSAAK